MSCHQRDAATHTARLQVGWFIIFMASEEVVGRWFSDARIASKILVPGSNPENHFFFLTDDGQKLVDK